jgi:hypothetical protein
MTIKVSDEIARSRAESSDYFRAHHDGWITTRVNRDNPGAVCQALADNAKKYADAAKAAAIAKGLPKPSKWVIRNRLRLRELEEALAAYYGRNVLPATSGGVSDLKLMVRHILFVHRDGNPCAVAQSWARIWAPWCNEEDLDLIIDEIGPHPHFMTDRELGEVLEVTDEVRERYGWRTIEAIDVTPKQRAAINRAKGRKRKEAKRRADGVQPRDEYEAGSLGKTTPWVPMGISKSTYFRRLKKARAAIVSAIAAHRLAVSANDSGVSPTNLFPLSRKHYCQRESDLHPLGSSGLATGQCNPPVALNDNAPVGPSAQADRLSA